MGENVRTHTQKEGRRFDLKPARVKLNCLFLPAQRTAMHQFHFHVLKEMLTSQALPRQERDLPEGIHSLLCRASPLKLEKHLWTSLLAPRVGKDAVVRGQGETGQFWNPG